MSDTHPQICTPLTQRYTDRASRVELTLLPTCLPGQGGTPQGDAAGPGNRSGTRASSVSMWFNRTGNNWHGQFNDFHERRVIKVKPEILASMEALHPGIALSVRYYEAAKLPSCPHCGAADAAIVTAGLVGRSIHLALATNKIKLLPNGPRPGNFYCNACGMFLTVH